jgi:hypothetical protein
VKEEANTQFLRHVLATIAYRGGKALRDAPATFAAFRAGPTSRTPLEILAHIGDLFDWAISITNGNEQWREATPDTWAAQTSRFYSALERLDQALATPLTNCPPERLFQGPLADALTHIGQLAMLRRLADAPVRGENYSRADIAAGRVGPTQSAPRREFD